MKASLSLILVASFCGCLASADGTPAPVDCSKAETQADINTCSGNDADKSKALETAALNAVYAQFKTDGPTAAAEIKSMQTAEKAFVAFMNAECDAETSRDEGGTIRPADIAGCMSTLLDQRTANLISLRKLLDFH